MSLPDTLPEVITESLIELAGLEAQRLAQMSDYIDWGVLTLAEGADSPALRRLAGLYSHDSLEDARRWLTRALKELGLHKPTAEQALAELSVVTARRILRGDLAAVPGLRRLNELHFAREQGDQLLWPICDLQAAAELREDQLESYAWLYPGFDARPLEELIRRECELYLALTEIAPPDLLVTSWCLACGQRDLAQNQPEQLSWVQEFWRYLAKNPRQYKNVCRHCGSTELQPLSDPDARDRFLREASA